MLLIMVSKSRNEQTKAPVQIGTSLKIRTYKHAVHPFPIDPSQPTSHRSVDIRASRFQPLVNLYAKRSCVFTITSLASILINLPNFIVPLQKNTHYIFFSLVQGKGSGALIVFCIRHMLAKQTFCTTYLFSKDQAC